MIIIVVAVAVTNFNRFSFRDHDNMHDVVLHSLSISAFCLECVATRNISHRQILCNINQKHFLLLLRQKMKYGTGKAKLAL